MEILSTMNGAAITYVTALNTRDGNPRRGWHITVRYRGRVTAQHFVDEGFEGIGALKKVFPGAESGAFPVEKITVPEYNRLKALPPFENGPIVRQGAITTVSHSLSDFEVGMRIQTHPATDSWARGDRFGTVEKVGRRYITVRLHVSGLALPFSPHNLIPV